MVAVEEYGEEKDDDAGDEVCNPRLCLSLLTVTTKDESEDVPNVVMLF